MKKSRMKKWAASGLLTLLCACALVLSGGVAQAVPATPITNQAELLTACGADGDYILMQSFELTQRVDVTKKVTLDLNGQTLSAALNGGNNGNNSGTGDSGVLAVRQGANLTINDSVGGGKISNSGDRFVLFVAGDATLNNGTLETTANLAGGGNHAVKIFAKQSEPASFTMTGGTLTTVGDTVLLNNGGAVELSGGSIIGPQNPATGDRNTLVANSMMYGGAVSRAQLAISGSAIVTAKNGAALHLAGCDFTMSGGNVICTYDLAPNSASPSAITTDKGPVNANSTFNLSGGSISGPTAIRDLYIDYRPDSHSTWTISGDVEITGTAGRGIESNGIFTEISGGTITGTKPLPVAAGGTDKFSDKGYGLWLKQGDQIGEIKKISGGTIQSTDDNALYNSGGLLGTISGGTFTAVAKKQYALNNGGTIDEISGGTFNSAGYGALYNRNNIKKISGGSFNCTGTGALYNRSAIDEISGGTFKGGQCAIFNTAKITQLTGGTFIGTVCAIYGDTGDNSLEPLAMTLGSSPTVPYGESRFFGGKKGDLIFNEAQVVTVPAGYKISQGTLPAAGYACHYLTKDSTVSFDSRGGSSVAAVAVENGQLLTAPPAPTCAGKSFDGWYKESACTIPWNFAVTPLTADLALYAKWQPAYALRVQNGTGSGAYRAGEVVPITAAQLSNLTFTKWTAAAGVVIAAPTHSTTTVIMPAAATTVTANYTDSGDDASEPQVPIIIDGKTQNIGKIEQTTDKTTVTVNQKELEKKLTAGETNGSLVVPVSDKKAHATAQLVVKNINDLAAKNSTLIVQSGAVDYNIPAKALDTVALMQALGATDAAQVPIAITITKSPAAVTISDSEVVLPPLAFEITASYGGKTVTVTDFDRYIARTVEITAEQAKRVTTAVVYEPNGTIRHIPTRVYQQGGRWYAEINSLTNSLYVLINHEKTFTDTAGKWYEAAVCEMAERKIIEGITADSFAGTQQITRAEFAALIVRCLGLPTQGCSSFDDVAGTDWSSGAINTAATYGLIEGVGQNCFRPQAPITRQEAMTMVQRAAVRVHFNGVGNSAVGSFSDQAQVSSWAQAAVNFNLANGLIIGDGGKICPQDPISRAETATVLLRLLQKAALVDIRTTV